MKSSTSPRRALPQLVAASGLTLAALAASAFLPSPSAPAPSAPAPHASQVLHDWMYSHGGTRHVQYDMETGEFLLVGEIAHGLDYFSGSGGFWWCSFGGHSGSPLLSFLLREATVEYHDHPEFYPPGLGLPYTDDAHYNLLRLEPLVSQKTTVNDANAGTAFPGDYVEIPHWDLEFFLYREVDGSFNIAVMDAGVAQQLQPGQGLGDGSANRDNGVRIDIAFRARLPLPPEKLAWIRSLNADSKAYPTEHPSGF